MAEDYNSQEFNISPDVIERLTNPTEQEPFAEPFNGAPFIDEFRKLSLNKLLHLAPYSGVLIVSGVSGAGKTTLLQQFVKRAGDTWRVVLISANASIDEQQFLRQVTDGFDLHLEAETSQDDVLWEIRRYLQSLDRSGRRAIIVIDDAELLPVETLKLLEKIIADEQVDDAIGAVLTTIDDKAIDFDDVPLIQEKLTYTLRFEPLTEAGTQAYIQHHLAVTGRADVAELFTTDAVSGLYKKSAGWPGEINNLARQLLGKTDVRKIDTTNAGLNIMRWGVAAAAVVAVVVVLVLQDDSSQQVEMLVGEGELVARGDIQRDAEAAKKTLLADLKLQTEVPVKAPPAPAIEMPPAPLESKVEVIAKRVAEEPVVQLGQISGADEIMPEPIPLPAEFPPLAESANAVEFVAEVEVESEQEREPKPKPVQAKVVATPKPAASDLIWLKRQAANDFTMQMMALEDAAKVKAFVKRHRLEGRSSTFEISRKGKQLTVLVYGSFATRKEASEAAADLPRSWGVKPWIRNFSSVQAELGVN